MKLIKNYDFYKWVIIDSDKYFWISEKTKEVFSNTVSKVD